MPVKAAILGVGRMGTAISYGMHKLGFYVIGADSNEHASQNFRDHISPSDGTFYLTDENNADKMMETALLYEKPDIIISSLPYHQTEMIAYWCIDNGFRYCDLGGRVDVSLNINKYAESHATKPVFTDLGLAPGWVNILAEQGYKELHSPVEDVRMMVGGLPDYTESVNNPLRYAVTWSVDGLINEYRDDCLVLEGGEIKTVRGMDGLEDVEGESFGKMEAFYTSGGASHSILSMQARGVKNCSYKTMRYKGHGEIVKFLIRDCSLDDKTLARIFQEGCGMANKDEVLIVAEVKGQDHRWRKEKVIKSDKRFSAMQKATAFSISSMAKIMAEGKLEGRNQQHRDYWTEYPFSLSYADAPFNEFNDNLEELLTDVD